MIYQVRFRERVLKELKSIPKRDLQKILMAVDLLAENPIPPNSKKLAGYDNLYRVRVGDWRVAYEIQNEQLIVFVIRIGHRKDVYRNL